MSNTLILALDWTPNTNHSGFYLGISKGWYAQAGIDLQIQPPSQAYTSSETPARRVVDGSADLCIAPSESVISSLTSDKGVFLKAVATVLQEDTSAIVTRTDSGVDSPALLDGKQYASYGGRFEMAIIRQMIRNAGGDGNVIEVNPPKLDCFDVVLKGEADSTWVFMGWEGIQADKNRVPLNVFPLKDSGVPYGYTPILLAHPKYLEKKTENYEILQKFMDISNKAFIYCSHHPEEAADALMNVSKHETLDVLGREFVIAAQKYISKNNCYLNSSGNWGYMEPSKWDSFVEWLFSNDCITARDGSVISKSLNHTNLFTNEFLEPKKDC